MRISCRLMVFALAVASCLAQNPKTGIFSGAVATDADLLAAKDLSSSTLTAGINNSTTSVPVADGTQFIAAEVIRIDDEQMLIASIATNTLTVSRAFGGTSAASHLSGAAVRGIITSSHHNQLAAEIKTMQARLRDATGYCADAGSNDTYACSPAPCIASYTAGNRFWFKANTANTGAATVNFCSIGAKTIKKAVGGVTTDLADNDIRAGQIVEVIYDGTNMQMLSVLGNAAASAAWGSITGTLSSQSDLQSALNAKLTTATGQAGTPTYCRSTTGNDTYTCSLTPTLTAYTRGGCLTLDADTANTLAASVNVDSLGAKSILNRAGSSLASGDITANKPITICYDGTQYIIQGDGGGSGSGDALKSEVQSGTYLTCSVGSGSSPHTCTMNPTLTAYTNGMRVGMIRTGGTEETGSATLNIDSLGAVAIKKHGTTTDPGSSCNVPAGPSVTVLTYDSTNGVFWLPPCIGTANRGDAVAGTNLQSGAFLYCPTGGTSTAYTCSVANSISGGNAPALGGYANGELFTVKIDATSGASPTLNIDSLGAKKIYLKYSNGSQVQVGSGGLIANRVYTFAYNSSLDSGSGGFEVNPGMDTGGFYPSITTTVVSVEAGKYTSETSFYSLPASTFTRESRTISSITTGATTTLTLSSSHANDIRIGYSLTIASAAGTGCSGLNGLHVVDSVPDTTHVVINYNSTGCTYTSSSATIGVNASGTGTAYVYMTPDGYVKLEYPAASGQWYSCTGTCLQEQVASTALNGKPIASITISGGLWNTLTNLLSIYDYASVTAGTDIDVTATGGSKVISLGANAVTKSGTNAYTGTEDARSAAATYPMRTVTADDASCTVGMFIFRSDTGDVKKCTATNTWTTMGGGGSTVGYALHFGSTGGFSPADATTYYLGGIVATNFGFSTAAWYIEAAKFVVPKAGTIKAASWSASYPDGGPGSNEGVTVAVCINGSSGAAGTCTNMTTSDDWSATYAQKSYVSGLSIAVSAGDKLLIKIVTPTWATNPTTVFFSGDLYIE